MSSSRSIRAASEFFEDGSYVFRKSGGPQAPSAGDGRALRGLGAAVSRSCPSRTASPKTTGTAGSCLTERLGEKVQLVGDDIFVTNPAIIRRGHRGGGRQRRPDQAQPDRHRDRDARRDRCGARRAVTRTVVSHRSGETEDDFIADLAVATARADQDGAPCARRPRGQVQPAPADRGGAGAEPALQAQRSLRRRDFDRAKAACLSTTLLRSPQPSRTSSE